MEGLWLKTGNPLYHQMTRFWTKVFALIFAIGVATGIVMEFEFGTNWATYSRYVGDVFGSALAAEGIFAFFLESGFLAVLLFGWDKVGRRLHFFATCMVCLGAHFSAVWIVVANSWQQTPAGYHIVGEGLNGPRAEITDFWAMVFNPSSMDRLQPRALRRLAGRGLPGRQRQRLLPAAETAHAAFARASMKIGLAGGLGRLAACSWSPATASAVGVGENQPAKLAAFEGHYETGPNCAALPLRLGGRGERNGAQRRGDARACSAGSVHGDADTPVHRPARVPAGGSPAGEPRLPALPPHGGDRHRPDRCSRLTGVCLCAGAARCSRQRWLLWLLVVLGARPADRQPGRLVRRRGRAPALDRLRAAAHLRRPVRRW